LVLLLIVLVAAAPVGRIPLAALRGVLFVTAVRMVRVPTIRAILPSAHSAPAGLVITALRPVSFDLILAAATRVGVASFFALRQLSSTPDVRIEHLSDRPDAGPGDESIAIVHFGGPLFFASADRIFDEVMRLQGVTVVVLRMSQLELVDATGAHILSDMVRAF